MLSSLILAALTLASSVSAAVVQGNCAKDDPTLQLLSRVISPSAVIACRGSPLQLSNAGRYWGKQYGKNASVVVYPLTTNDVSLTVKAACLSKYGDEFAFVSGAHAQTNASTATGFVIDLSWMNSTQVLKDVQVADVKIPAAVAYQPGGKWGDIARSLGGSGYAAVGARMSTVGAGGFSTGGGIGFLAGAYGYAIDRLQAVEVVLVSGQVVNATRTNKYSDLFWAIQGGNGQFGIVTKFYQLAAPEPRKATLGIYFVDASQIEQANQNTVNFFNNNRDPFAVLYYTLAYTSQSGDPTQLGKKILLSVLQFDDPNVGAQQSYNETFAPLLEGLNVLNGSRTQDLPYSLLTLSVDGLFPAGFRRGFYGPRIEKINTDFLGQAYAKFNEHIDTLLAQGEVPATATWAVQYNFPGSNGNLPKSDADTAWPHSISGHQTLFSPAWNKAEDDGFVLSTNEDFNQITRANQALLGRTIPDYPNYISPNVKASQVFGGNLPRLNAVKQKYDPECKLHQGRVFASRECVKRGFANFVD